jgi:branched-chain amino acid transport system substrate-binding protein
MTGLIAAFALIVSLAGCGDGADSNTTQIAIVGPVTGQYASFGAQMQNGGELAVEDINAAGGVLGKQLELEIGDDACDPKQAVAVANQMIGSGVVLVAGHYCSGSSIPASKVDAESDTVQISPASTNPAFTDDRAGPNIYRVCGRDDQQGGIAGNYLAKHFADKNIAIVHDKTAYGKGHADETKNALNAAGKQEAMYEAITAGEKDYSALVSKLKQAKIDVLFLGGYHTEAGLIVRQMRDQGLNTILMGQFEYGYGRQNERQGASRRSLETVIVPTRRLAPSGSRSDFKHVLSGRTFGGRQTRAAFFSSMNLT